MSTDGINGKEPKDAEHGANATGADGNGTPFPAPSELRVEAGGQARVGPDTIFTGQLLRQVRENQRLTLKEISERTKISVASLAALEEERYEDLPNARVYVRGFVRCLAAEIGLDRDLVSRTYVPRWEAWFYEQNHAR